MFATIRRYVDLPGSVVARVVALAPAIGDVLSGAPGFCDCRLIQTREGLVVVLSARDEPSVVACCRRSAAWLDRHVDGFRAVAPPEVWSGNASIAASLDARVTGPP